MSKRKSSRPRVAAFLVDERGRFSRVYEHRGEEPFALFEQADERVARCVSGSVVLMRAGRVDEAAQRLEQARELLAFCSHSQREGFVVAERRLEAERRRARPPGMSERASAQ